MLWLSIIVLVPFDLTTIDSGEKKNQEILVKRIMNIGVQYTEHSGKLRDGAAILLSKLITRPDVVKSGETDTFLKKMAADYAEGLDDAKRPFVAAGILQTLVEIFKTGHRDDLLSRVDLVFDPVLKTEQKKTRKTVKSTLLTKAKANLA